MILFALAFVGCGGSIEPAPDHCVSPTDAGDVADSATVLDAGADAPDAACTPQYAQCVGDCHAIGDGNGEASACIASTCSCDMTAWF